MHLPISDAFARFISDEQLFNQDSRLIIAVSGGLDSVVLCHLLHQGRYTFNIAHCHFGLRNEESDRDAAFVEALANQYGRKFLCRRFSTDAFAADQKLSIQEAARLLRYDWFENLCTGAPMRYAGWSELAAGDPDATMPLPACLVTAHHGDDNIETVAMNFFKGTGLAGLRGMVPRQGRVLRPLLFARRSQLEEYARTNKLNWVEDSSNASTKYTRNFFRHEVLPLIAQKMPQVTENLTANIRRFAEIEQVFTGAIDQYRAQLMEQRGNEWFVPVLKLSRLPAQGTVVFELLRPFGFTAAQLPSLLQLMQADSGRYVASQTHQVLRHRRWLVISPLQAEELTMLVVEPDRGELRLGNLLFVQDRIAMPKDFRTEPDTALVDAALLQYPLVLRRWKAGDYFYPIGLRKKKKVSRLLIDLKCSRSEKERVWVLESGKKIVWVAGMRLDDRFKLSPGTKEVVRFRLQPIG